MNSALFSNPDVSLHTAPTFIESRHLRRPANLTWLSIRDCCNLEFQAQEVLTQYTETSRESRRTSASIYRPITASARTTYIAYITDILLSRGVIEVAAVTYGSERKPPCTGSSYRTVRASRSMHRASGRAIIMTVLEYETKDITTSSCTTLTVINNSCWRYDTATVVDVRTARIATVIIPKGGRLRPPPAHPTFRGP
ncbi:hypothetical protein EVAR_60631_1 [Eumeta japonica]|uniref:Uncharacterized protein n=1 Tax=Eumeta variegata TaxID=151549 RepID=A0A4C2A9E8_EUMVA|nr:hypothetical protein EVAR_60631_1 [Eumeta japonica]